jgi:L-aspartate oxidase
VVKVRGKGVVLHDFSSPRRGPGEAAAYDRIFGHATKFIGMPNSTDVLIVGGGLAGLTAALRLAEHTDVTLLAKSSLTEGSSLYAQGGVAAVLDQREDSFESHIEDTLKAGAGLCRRETVEFVVRGGPQAIAWLVEQGTPFTPADSGNNVPFHLTREGGHSHRRVVHAADATGRAIVTALAGKVSTHPRIRILDNHLAIDLITRHKLGLAGEDRCLGLYALDKASGRVVTIPARNVVLATGGASKVYLYTSNPDTATGDGVAMAWRAGCRVANMEFVQFHPTCLWHPRAKSFLITEAVRGEGGRLLLPGGESFMHRHDPRGELAPRDIVARAIDFEMKRRGLDYVLLDISFKPREFITSHFPTIYEKCLSLGYDMAREPIPVVPAAHYTCGGVVTNLAGHTDLAGLYAIGECGCTGLHGANRLASNSLLACLVFGESAAGDIRARLSSAPTPPSLPAWDESRVTDADEAIVVSHNWDELRRGMWDYVGIVRTTKRLERAMHRVALLKEEIREYYSNFKITNDLIELRNLVQVAELIIRCALARRESRGLHYTRDFPSPEPRLAGVDTVLTPPGYEVAIVRAAS